MGDQSLDHLLREVREVELTARRNVTSLLSGNYRTTIPGQGTDFHEARRYVQGESVRKIDWKITARLREPHVRTYLEEREREVILAVDVSPSMTTGFVRRTKLELAVELAATLAVSAVEAGDRLGLVTFSDRVHEQVPPRRGKRALFHVLRTLARHQVESEEPRPPCDESDPRTAIHAIQRLRGRRFVVFILSDFIDHDVPDDLRFIRRRHDVSLLHLYDPIEYTSCPDIRWLARSPEGRSTPSAFRLGETGGLSEIQAFLRTEAERFRIAMHSFSTSDDVGPALQGFFRAKRRRLER